RAQPDQEGAAHAGEDDRRSVRVRLLTGDQGAERLDQEQGAGTAADDTQPGPDAGEGQVLSTLASAAAAYPHFRSVFLHETKTPFGRYLPEGFSFACLPMQAKAECCHGSRCRCLCLYRLLAVSL